jgi:peroxiredoxin
MTTYAKLATLLLFGFSLINVSSNIFAESPNPTTTQSAAAKSELKFDESVLKLELENKTGDRSSIGSVKEEIVVLVFLGLECPVANTYVSEIRGLQEKYQKEKEKLAWIGIYSEVGATRDAAKIHTDEYKITMPIVIDSDQRVAHGLGAKVLGQVVVLKDKKVVYRGRIDDRFATNGKRRDRASTRELADALDAALAGKDVRVAETAAYGCPIPKPAVKK